MKGHLLSTRYPFIMAQIRASVDWENYIKLPCIMETKGLG